MSQNQPPNQPQSYPQQPYPQGGPQTGPPPGYYPPQPPPKKKHTVRNILLALILLFVLIVGGCMALIGGAANEVDKSMKKDAAQPGGPDNPLTIKVGKAFEVNHFNYAAGWKVTGGMMGLDIKGLKVTNNRDGKDSALVEIKFWKGTEVLASSDCSTDPIQPGTTVSMLCSSTDNLPKRYDKITINDTF